jgi:hypothetical protein
MREMEVHRAKKTEGQGLFFFFVKKLLTKIFKNGIIWRRDNGRPAPNFRLVKTNLKNFSKWHAWPRCHDFPEIPLAGPGSLLYATISLTSAAVHGHPSKRPHPWELFAENFPSLI